MQHFKLRRADIYTLRPLLGALALVATQVCAQTLSPAQTASKLARDSRAQLILGEVNCTGRTLTLSGEDGSAVFKSLRGDRITSYQWGYRGGYLILSGGTTEYYGPYAGRPFTMEPDKTMSLNFINGRWVLNGRAQITCYASR
jgi:hypothetical protein